MNRPDLFHSPEKFGLKIIGNLSWDDDPYQFDMTTVWQDITTGELFYASDSGCSCPSPFEALTSRDGLTPFNLQGFIDYTGNRLGRMKKDTHFHTSDDVAQVEGRIGELILKVRTAQGKPLHAPPKPAPVPMGVRVMYMDRVYVVVEHDDPQQHPAPPSGDYDLTEVYPDGVAYTLWPEDVPRKFGNRGQSVLWVRRTSFTVIED
jgi:hypothetical protein